MLSGTCKTVLEDLTAKPTRRDEWTPETKPIIDEILAAIPELDEAITFIKSNSTPYRDLVARKLVDMGVFLLIGAMFADQAATTVDDEMATRKLIIAKQWMSWRMPEFRMNKEKILSGDQHINTDFETLAGAVPVVE